MTPREFLYKIYQIICEYSKRLSIINSIKLPHKLKYMRSCCISSLWDSLSYRWKCKTSRFFGRWPSNGLHLSIPHARLHSEVGISFQKKPKTIHTQSVRSSWLFCHPQSWTDSNELWELWAVFLSWVVCMPNEDFRKLGTTKHFIHQAVQAQ